jgi:hypothetical protein
MHLAPRVISLSLVVAAACIPDPVQVGGGGGSPDAGMQPGPNTEAMIREWSGCMTLDHFRLAGMNTAWGSMPATNGQACSSCHGTGFEGFYADRDEAAMFKAITSVRQFLLQYFTIDPAGQKMVVNTAVFQAVGTGQPPHQGHPPFNPTNNAGMTALRSFYDVTSLQQQAHTCDPPRLP